MSEKTDSYSNQDIRAGTHSAERSLQDAHRRMIMWKMY